jgi:hypothetical protein
VAFFLQRRQSEARRADQRAFDEGAEGGTLLEPERDLVEAAAGLLVERCREGARVVAQRLQPARLEGRRIGAAK